MKDSRRSRRTSRTRNISFARSRKWSRETVRARTKRLIDKLQVLALRRPNTLLMLESVLDGFLLGSRINDGPNGENGENGENGP